MKRKKMALGNSGLCQHHPRGLVVARDRRGPIDSAPPARDCKLVGLSVAPAGLRGRAPLFQARQTIRLMRDKVLFFETNAQFQTGMIDRLAAQLGEES